MSEPQALAILRKMAADGTARRVRVASGLSGRELATSIGVAPSTLWRWEHGERLPRNGDAAERYAHVLIELGSVIP